MRKLRSKSGHKQAAKSETPTAANPVLVETQAEAASPEEANPEAVNARKVNFAAFRRKGALRTLGLAA